MIVDFIGPPSFNNFYLSLAKIFYVGRKRIFSMELKPRNLTGLILAIVNPVLPTKGDFVVLELDKGSVSEISISLKSLMKFFLVTFYHSHC